MLVGLGLHVLLLLIMLLLLLHVSRVELVAATLRVAFTIKTVSVPAVPSPGLGRHRRPVRGRRFRSWAVSMTLHTSLQVVVRAAGSQVRFNFAVVVWG